jgi:DNA-binding GntR family transcriptional regulator
MAILEGEFKGGDQLVEQDLQAHFSVSRSPLREAFRELEKKGLVDIIPRRGTFVKRISRADIEENFPVRAALEGLAARLALANMSEGNLVRMSEILEQMKSAVAAGDTKAYYNHHLVFHELFIQFSANKLLITTLNTLRMQSLWHRFSYQYYLEDLEKSFRVHQEIYALFSDSKVDPERVRALVEDHINTALGRFLEYLKDFERE